MMDANKRARAAETEVVRLRERIETLETKLSFSDEAVRVLRKALGWIEAEASVRGPEVRAIYGRVCRALEEITDLERRAALSTGEDTE